MEELEPLKDIVIEEANTQGKSSLVHSKSPLRKDFVDIVMEELEPLKDIIIEEANTQG